MRVALVGILVSFGGLCLAADWPQVRADAGRTGYTAEELPGALSLRWTYKPAHPPAPAWPGDARMAFDRAPGLVAAGDALFFGSSADDKIYALDAATGRERWAFFTGGPVRFAPAVWKDRVLAVSDDGYLYCLAAKDGQLLWKKRGGPDDQMLIGNGRMISRWPARGGPVILGDILYFAAGIWPVEGVYVHALNLPDGESVWTNGTTGYMIRTHPHEVGGRSIASGIGAQGYLAAADDLLLVPTGRGLPLALSRADGKFRYFHGDSKCGSADTVIAKPYFFNHNSLFDLADGRAQTLNKNDLSFVPAVAPKFIAGVPPTTRGDQLCVLDGASPLLKAESSGRMMLNVLTNLSGLSATSTVIIAGNTLFAGTEGRVVAVDAATRQVRPVGSIDGFPCSLAVAGGRLFVSSDRGVIACFDGQTAGQSNVVEGHPATVPAEDCGRHAAAAEEIVKKSGITEGYCLDLGCGGGELALELARRTKLRIVGIESDPALVAAARRRLDAAGLYGVRVTVHQADPGKAPLPRYFANLVVSGRSVTEGAGAAPAKTAQRCQRPFGGVICVGRPGEMSPAVRGPLEGAGTWTHLYGNAGNTYASEDTLVRAPLRVLWFGGPDLDVPDRHGRPPGPLFADGRMYVLGIDGIRAVDAYNGHLIWECPLKGVGKPYDSKFHMTGDNGNFCLAPEGLFMRMGSQCVHIDSATGKEVGRFEAPAKTGRWGYIACEGGRLYGSVANEEHVVSRSETIRTESSSLFALDVRTGKTLWTYTAKDSIRHNAVAVGGGKVFLIDRPRALLDQNFSKNSKPKEGEHPAGRLVALDAATGKEVWSSAEDIYGTMLAFSTKHDAVLMGYQKPIRFSLPSELGDRLAVFEASTGKRLWDEAVAYSQPIIVDRTVYVQTGSSALPTALDLLTGKPAPIPGAKASVRGFACGLVTGSPELLLFRSGPLGYVDLRNGELRHYGGIRPGCWINAIPAGGLVLMPDFTRGCSCSYQNQTNLALEGVRDAGGK